MSTRLVKLTGVTDKEVWVNPALVAMVYQRSSATSIRFGPELTVPVKETPEEIAAKFAEVEQQQS